MSASGALHALREQQALRNVDLAFADLLRRLGGSADVQLAGALAMRAVALGHSGFTLARAAELLDELDAQAALPDTAGWAAALQDSALVADGPVAQAPLVFQHGRVALRRYAGYEAQLVHALQVRAQPREVESTDADESLARLFDLSPDALDRQALAAWVALRQPLTLVTGGPGTGKTTTVARMLALLAARHPAAPPRIALAAPTGRAAARLGEAIAASLHRDVAAGRLDAAIAAQVPREAQTLHRLLGWRSGQVGFRHHAGMPLPYDAVVVDEASMIDLPLMAKLVDAVAPQARLLLLGDPDQLPAVEAGDVLGALCETAGDGLGLPSALAAPASTALRANVPVDDTPAPLAGHRIHLVRGYRQAGAARLGALAQAVRLGDADHARALLGEEDAQLQWRHGEAGQLESLLHTQVLPLYRALPQAADPQAALAQAQRVRVLTALRRGPFGAQAWNRWFAQQLGAGGQLWFPGRLVMVTANSYRHGLFNGDTGIAWADDDGELVVWFEQGGHLRAWRPGQLPQHDSAFAGTVHKAQGSEFDRVVLVLPDRDSRVLNRELLYTGLTRARTTASLWAAPDVLAQAIARRTLRDSGLVPRFADTRPA